ncbi:T4 family baseplate hub assembly chaperone [Streptomyces tubercidicus]|uniref:T4 family baseplate hub assembly chaperone n=1 Tax=Streptomyces tubercidicus TaxID=47759 RepID=UPI00367B74FE
MTDAAWDFDELGGNVTTLDTALGNPEGVNAQVQQALSESASPEPVISEPEDTHYTLPGGIYWEGELLRDAEVRELTGTDEEELARVRGSVVRWMSVVLERNVVRIGNVTPTPTMLRQLLIGDRDALILGIRIASLGPEYTARNIQCPHCEEYFDATVDLTTIHQVTLDNPKPRHEYEVQLRRGRRAFVSLPDGAAQERMFQNESATLPERNTALISACLRRVVDAEGAGLNLGGEVLARSLGMVDRTAILRFIAETQPGPELHNTSFVHEACGKEVILPITIGELFRGE